MNKKLFGVSLAAVMLLSVGLLGACQKDSAGPYVMPEWSGRPNEDNSVAVHDPSIFYDEASSTYYAFGSHFAVASSTDLLTWEQEVGDNNWQALYGTAKYGELNWPATLGESVDLVNPQSDITTT